jgi:hydroxyethylthiazole kinase-like uncharacterized protein yjeF
MAGLGDTGEALPDGTVPHSTVPEPTLPEWTVTDAAPFIRVPSASDDKYGHGVLGVVTGSDVFPGAAVLGVDAACATGVGMVRFLGDPDVARQVMHRRPETVTVDGRVQAWLIGSGTEWTEAGSQTTAVQRVLDAGEPVVIDAGALPLAGLGRGISVVTPHHAECARLLDITRDEVDTDPLRAANSLADQRSVTVVLKGHTTLVVSPQSAGERFARRLTAPTTWLATAGTGDVLAGIMGALLPTHADDLAENPDSAAPIAATAVLLHGLAAVRAGSRGPFGASDIAAHLAQVIADILEHRDDSQHL